MKFTSLKDKDDTAIKAVQNRIRIAGIYYQLDAFNADGTPVNDEAFDIVYGAIQAAREGGKPLSTKTEAGLVANTFKFDCSDISKHTWTELKGKKAVEKKKDDGKGKDKASSTDESTSSDSKSTKSSGSTTSSSGSTKSGSTTSSSSEGTTSSSSEGTTSTESSSSSSSSSSS